MLLAALLRNLTSSCSARASGATAGRSRQSYGGQRLRPLHVSGQVHSRCRHVRGLALCAAGRSAGNILLTALVAGLGPFCASPPTYCAAKAGVLNFMRSAAPALLEKGIRCLQCSLPGCGGHGTGALPAHTGLSARLLCAG